MVGRIPALSGSKQFSAEISKLDKIVVVIPSDPSLRRLQLATLIVLLFHDFIHTYTLFLLPPSIQYGANPVSVGFPVRSVPNSRIRNGKWELLMAGKKGEMGREFESSRM